MQKKVIEWIASGCDYNQGIALLSETGKHKQLIRVITGRPHRYATKLLYELCKVAGINHHLVEPGKEYTGCPVPPANDKQAGNALPGIIEKVIKEHSHLFNLRAQLHEQMSVLPEDNEEETVKKRKNLSDSIEIMSARIELLFAAKENFYNNGQLPEMEILFPEPPADPQSTEALLPDNTEELKKMKKNLQSANTKDQNLLNYQQEKKGEKLNPMPKGPKSLKLEMRINERLETIEKIDFKLLSLAN